MFHNFRHVKCMYRYVLLFLCDFSSSPADGVHIAKGLDDAVALLSTEDMTDLIESVFIIGGASIYEVG